MWCSQRLFRAQLAVLQPSNKSHYVCGTSEHGFEWNHGDAPGVHWLHLFGGAYQQPAWRIPAWNFPELNSAGAHWATYPAEWELSVSLSQHP